MRKKLNANKDKRDSGRFAAFPHAVLDSLAYRSLGYSSIALLIDIAKQYTSSNNGRLVACEKYLKPLGWKSNATISKALHELLDSGLLIRTRMGYKPNRAAWYALAWYQLDPSDGIEMTNAEFLRVKTEWKFKVLTPKSGVASNSIAPIYGGMHKAVAPISGAIHRKNAMLLPQ